MDSHFGQVRTAIAEYDGHLFRSILDRTEDTCFLDIDKLFSLRYYIFVRRLEMRSVITSKYQTTIPKEIRETLKLSVHDAVEWRINGNVAVVSPTQQTFLSRRGAVKTGKGDIAADIAKARLVRSGRR